MIANNIVIVSRRQLSWPIISIRLLVWAAGLLLVVSYLVLANDGRHHWHEFRHLYSAANYTTAELMAGEFDPGPAPVRTDDEIADWYATKLFHIYLLRQLVNLFGTGLDSFNIIKTIYGLMMLGAIALIALAFKVLGMTSSRVTIIAGLLLFDSITVYLGFKLMPEVTALLFSAAAMVIYAACTKQRRLTMSLIFAALAGIALSLSALSTWRVPFLFLGFWVAILLVWEAKTARKRVLITGLITGFSFLISTYIGLSLLGGSFNAYFSAISAFLTFTKSLPMWMFALFNIGLVGLALWFLLPFAWLSPDKHSRRFFLIWLIIAGIPVIVTSIRFMEPRYLLSAFVPFTGLAALGFESLWSRLNWGDNRQSINPILILAGVMCGLILASSFFVQRFMPYESKPEDLIEAVETEAPAGSSTAVLLPWNYTDFHLLRFIFPERPIYLVQTATTESGKAVQDPEWTSQRVKMYGDYYLPDAASLQAIDESNLIYIGWTILPSLQNLNSFLRLVKLDRLAVLVESSSFLNHLTQSWLWRNREYPMQQIELYGQYRVFNVRHQPLMLDPGHDSTSELQPSNPDVLQIPMWDMFESTVTNDRSYSNPFVDTELQTLFTSPSGQNYDFYGFYDGDGNGGQSGNVWKLRFMCMELGTWTWSATFTDDAPGDSGSFQCVNSNLPGPLQLDSSNSHWLIQANGNHFMPRWYYLHELLFSPDGVWQQDVDNLIVNPGYNMVTVLFTQAEHLNNQGWSYREYEEPYFYPWVKSGSTVQWDTFNLASWQKFDRVLEYLQDWDIYLYNFDGFFPNIAPHFPDDQLLEEAYLRYALARLGPQWNVTHNIAFEFSEFMSTARLNRIGDYIESIDPFSTLLTVHDTQNYDSLVENEVWIDLANLQYAAGTAGSAATSNPFVLNHTESKPVASTEVVWEGDTKLTGDQVRQGAWGILMAGSFPLYGEFDLNGHTGVGPYGAGRAHPYLKIMLDFIESIPFWRMKPHNELVAGSTEAYALAEPGRQYVIYAPNGGTIRLNLTNGITETGSGSARLFASDWVLERRLEEVRDQHTYLPLVLSTSGLSGFWSRWLNPETGDYSDFTRVTGGPTAVFSIPDNNDWVLEVRLR